jgi:putative protease
MLQQNSAERLISVDVDVNEIEEGFRLEMSDDYGRKVEVCVAANKELAHTPQTENVKRQLSRLGGTGFELRECRLKYRNNWFIPSSLLGEWRRMLVAEMCSLPLITVSCSDEWGDSDSTSNADAVGVDASLTYLSNVMNSRAAEFYKELGAVSVDPAFEQEHRKDVPVMFCKHCIRYSLGLCAKSEGGRRGDYRGGRLFLRLSNGKRFRLEFDCSECMMKVYVAE